jgi:hypothetical protein
MQLRLGEAKLDIERGSHTWLQMDGVVAVHTLVAEIVGNLSLRTRS